jgi:hypothetical protein
VARRYLLGTARNEALAHLYLVRLRDHGLPVTLGNLHNPYPLNEFPIEVWLSDIAILDEPGVLALVERSFKPLPEDELPEDFDVGPPTEMPREVRPLRTFLQCCLGLLLVAVVWVVFFAYDRKPHNYAFMRLAHEYPLDKSDAGYLDQDSLYGRIYTTDANLDEFLERVRKEMRPRGFTMYQSGQSWFVLRHEPFEWYQIWVEALGEGEYGKTVDRIGIFWAYEPTISERIARMLGR